MAHGLREGVIWLRYVKWWQGTMPMWRWQGRWRRVVQRWWQWEKCQEVERGYPTGRWEGWGVRGTAEKRASDGGRLKERGQMGALRLSYWAVALLLSPHPRISTTTPLLLHSVETGQTVEKEVYNTVITMLKYSNTKQIHWWTIIKCKWVMKVSTAETALELVTGGPLTLSKPMAQSLSILRVYSGLEEGAPAYTWDQSLAVCLNISGFCLYWGERERKREKKERKK